MSLSQHSSVRVSFLLPLLSINNNPFLLKCSPLSPHFELSVPVFVQLEDDIVAKPNYFATMKNFALQLSSEDWMILEFSQLGFIGTIH